MSRCYLSSYSHAGIPGAPDLNKAPESGKQPFQAHRPT